jgi:chlorophyllase-like protein
MRAILLTVLILVLHVTAGFASRPVVAQTATPAPATRVEQPAQPSTGPGGADLAYDGILAQHFGPPADGNGGPAGYWLFEPTRPRPITFSGPLPLVLFLHGFDLVDPESYHVWIDHLVRRGAIVIYPDYQPANLPFARPTVAEVYQSAPPVVAAAVQDALIQLAQPGHAQPDLGKMAVVGHSLGATLGADFAGRATPGLPQPAALFLVMPGCPPSCDLSHLSQIPPTTRVLVLVGSQDNVAGEDPARRIWAGLGQIPASHKDFIELHGDGHGAPSLYADHFVSLTTQIEAAGTTFGNLNVLDWYGTWKWLDALMTCSFAGQDCQVALGNTPEQRFMGVWSDGVAVREPQVTDDPGPPTVAAATPLS